MEKFLVLSDTHGNLDLLDMVLQRENNCTAIIHLGDNYEDLERCSNLPEIMIYRVPGIFHKGYRDKSLPAIIKVKSNDWSILLVHDLNDASEKVHDVDIYLHGHTHKPGLINEYGKIFFNPGHLKQISDRGNPASYGIIKLDKKNANFSVKNLQQNVIYNKTFKKLGRKNDDRRDQ